MRFLIPWGCALACAAVTPIIHATAATAAPAAPAMSCRQIRDAQAVLDRDAEKIRLRVQAQTRGEGTNVRAAREMIALLPGVYAGAKGEQLLEEARKMDHADAFIDADRVKPGQTPSADQKALAGIQARMAELDRAYARNPDCEDRGEFAFTHGRR
ncbi:MAG: hypothetical protein AB1942_03700 [Pseudomonadota bacterium]